MSTRTSPIHIRPSRRRTLSVRWAWWAALVTALTGAWPAVAAEFATPPGMNVARQEEVLREEVTRIANDLVGDDLVEVTVKVTYARADRKEFLGTQTERIKLPGFHRFIATVGKDKVEIQPEYVRLRQIFVMVNRDLESRAESLAREIRNQGDYNPNKGDWVQVIAVSAAKGDDGMPQAKEPDAGQPKQPGQQQPQRRPRRPSGPSSEPESTSQLLRARTAYFEQDYNRALRHILRAIDIEPNNSQAYAMLGSLYYTINWKNLALKYWERSLEIDPDNKEVEDLVAELTRTE